MRNLFLPLALGLVILPLVGCEQGGVTPDARRSRTTLEIGNGENNQLDRGVAKGSSANPQVENGMRPETPARPQP